jgi:hypothetical protein
MWLQKLQANHIDHQGFGYFQPQCGNRKNLDKRLALNISMDLKVLGLQNL